jgi:hypothetical protein
MEQAVRNRDAKAVGETVALHFTLLKGGLLEALDEQMTPENAATAGPARTFK